MSNKTTKIEFSIKDWLTDNYDLMCPAMFEAIGGTPTASYKALSQLIEDLKAASSDD